MLSITVLVSGTGTNLQALIDAQGKIITNGRINLVISSRPGVYALERAAKSGIPTRVISRKDYGSAKERDEALLKCLNEAKTDLVVLAGYLSILGETVTHAYADRIINIHPALIPSFCGNGFYGLKVHEEVLKRGVKVTGATVHFVNDVTDGGPIILQKAVDVMQDDTPEILQQRVMHEAEWVILPKAVGLFCDRRLKIENGRVLIIPKEN